MKRNNTLFLLLTVLMAWMSHTDMKAQKSWDFTTDLSSAEVDLLKSDDNWVYDSSKNRYTFTGILKREALKASGIELERTKGLLFNANNSQIRVGEKRLWLSGAASEIVIPNLKAGQKVTVKFKTSSSSAARTFTTTNLQNAEGFVSGTNDQTGTGDVQANGDVVLTPTGGLYVYSIEVSAVQTMIEGRKTEVYTDLVGNNVPKNLNADQMQVELTDGDIYFYNTADLNAVDVDKQSSVVTITPYNGRPDTFYGSVKNVSFAKGLDEGSDAEIINNGVEITEARGWLESAYVKWNLYDGATSYVVYVKGGQYSSYTKLDDQLVRNYGSYGRADAVGLRASADYAFKVVPVIGDAEDETKASIAQNMTVENYSRQGFAFLNRSEGVGAYNNDGTLKSNARVLYVTAKTAKTIQCDVIINAKGGTQSCTGIQSILDAYQKGYDSTPLAFRIVGMVSLSDLDHISSSEEGLQVKSNKDNEMNITFEGIGEDATIKNFGFLLHAARSVELRNFGIILFMDDAVSIDSDNKNVWVHHLDIFYGQSGSDSDQVKGDGSIDVKSDSQYITISYNRFWDAGKSSLCGMKNESGPNYISYDHNWFDHSDSRHPRVRSMSVHIWNNYFDGVAKYGVGSTMGSSVFVENNYFRGTKYPMLISEQGTDIAADGTGTFSGENGGIIKSFGNVMTEKPRSYRYVTYQQDAVEFDAWEATSRDDQVPSSVKSKAGSNTYDNFDTNPSLMYDYEPEAAADVPAKVCGWLGAGRMNHGDFYYDLSGSDSSYEIDASLKAALTAYTSSLVGIFGDESAQSGEQGSEGGEGGEQGGEGGEQGGETADLVTCYFTGGAPSNSMFTVIGNYATNTGTAVVDGVTYSECLKIESSTVINFRLTQPMTMTLYFGSTETASMNIDGTAYVGTGNTLTQTLDAGFHELKKKNTGNLFFIKLTK